MATYYWVGGNGTWDTSSTANWSLSSGGAGGAGNPTNGDDVIFNTASGTGFTVDVNSNSGNPTCRDITIAASTSVTFAPSINGTVSVFRSASFLSTSGSGGNWSFIAGNLGSPVTASINLAAHTNLGSVIFNGFGFGTFNLTGNITFNAATNSYIEVQSCVFNTSTFTISNWNFFNITVFNPTTANLAAAVTGNSGSLFRITSGTLNLTAALSADTIQFQEGTINLNATTVTCLSFSFSNLSSFPPGTTTITTTAGQIINVRDNFFLGFSTNGAGTAIPVTLRTINFTAGGSSSPTAEIWGFTGGNVSITSMTAAAGVTPVINAQGYSNPSSPAGALTITTLTSGITAALDNASSITVSNSWTSASGANWTIGAVNIFSPITLSGTLTLNADTPPPSMSHIATFSNGATLGAFTATRVSSASAFFALVVQDGGAFSITGTTNTTGRIGVFKTNSTAVSFGTTTAQSLTITGSIGTNVAGAVTLGALTLTGEQGGGGAAPLTVIAASISLTSANFTGNITVNNAVEFDARSTSVTVSGTITAGAASNRGGVYVFSTTSTSLAAVNASRLTIDAGTSAAHGLFTATYPTTYGAGSPIGLPIAYVRSTDANITCGGIDAQFDNFQLDSNNSFAYYETRGTTGNVTFSGAVTLGTVANRKGLQVISRGTSSFVAITAAWVDLTSVGNLTAAGTITLSNTLNANSYSFSLNIGTGSTATFNAATTAVSMTGVTEARVFRIEGGGNATFTTAVATTAGVITFALYNTGTTSFATAISANYIEISGPACTFSSTTAANAIYLNQSSGTVSFVGATTVTASPNADGGVRLYSATSAVSFAALSCVYISSQGGPFSPQNFGNITTGALTVSGVDPVVGWGVYLFSSGAVTIASINVTAPSDVRINATGNIAIAGAVDVGPAGNKGYAALTSTTGSVAHGAYTGRYLSIIATTTVTQGAITITYPFASISGLVIDVTTGGNISTGAITADFSVDTTSNYQYAGYSTTAGGAITFGGTVSLGTTTYRKGLIATVSGGSGAISYAAINASFVNFTTPGNITGTGTVTLSCFDAVTLVPKQFLLDVGGAATNTAATTAVSTTGIPTTFFSVFRVQGAGSVSFTNAIAGNLGGVDYEIANTGTFSCAAITGRLFSVTNGNNATFGAVSGARFDSSNTGTLTTGAITMTTSGGDGVVNIYNTGTATLNGALSCVSFYRSDGNLTLGAFTYAAAQLFYVEPGYVLTPSTSTVSVGNASATDVTFDHGGYTYNVVNMTGRRGFVGSNVAGTGFSTATFAFTGTANPQARAIFYGNMTVTGTGAGALTFTGNSLVNRLSIESYTAGTPVTLSCGNTRVLTNVDFTDITAAGGTLPWALGTSIGNCSGNTNITFTPSVIRYAVATGNWDSTTVWSATSGGAAGATAPLAQDNVIFNTASGAITVTVNSRRALCNDLTMTGSTATISFTGNDGQAFVYGSVVVPSTVTVTGNSSAAFAGITFSARAQQLYSYSPTEPENLGLTIYAPNTTVVLSSNLNVASVSVTAGTLNTQAGGAPPNYTITTNSLVVGGAYNSGVPVDIGFAPVYTGTIQLTANSSTLLARTLFYVYAGTTFASGTSNVIIQPTTGNATILFQGTGSAGTFYDLTLDTSSYAPAGGPQFTSFVVFPFTVSNQLRTTLTSNKVGTIRNWAVTFSNVTNPFEFSNAAYYTFSGCTLNLSVAETTNNIKYTNTTVVGPTLRAYGLANLGGNTNIEFASTLVTDAFYATNATYKLPPSVQDFIITVVGGGGQAGKASSSNVTAGGGGGGGVAILQAFQTLTPGSTIYVNAASPSAVKTTAGNGNTGGLSWVNFTSNVAPASSAQGVLANGGAGGQAGGTGGSGGAGSFGTLNYTGGAGNRGGGTARLDGTGYAGAVRGGAGTAGNASTNTGGAGSPGSGGTGGTNSARTPTAATAGVNGGGGGGGGQILQVRTASQPASRTAGSSTCVINATSHGLLTGETANISFGFKTGTYTTGAFTSATASRTNGSTTLSVTTSGAHNLTNGDTVNISAATFRTGTYSTATVNSNSITRANGSTTCTIVTTAAHGLTNGDTINLAPSFRSGTYSRSGTLVTCNVTSHGLVNGQTYYIDFTSGAALDGSYVVTVVTANQFRVTTVASGTTSGNVTIGGSSQLTAQNYTVTVTDSTTFTITTAQSTGFFSSVTSTVRTPIATCSVTSHGLTNGQTYYLDFTSGSGPDGNYVVTVINSNSFSVNFVTTPNTSGNMAVGASSQFSTGNYTVTVTGSNTFTITTAQNTGLLFTVNGTTPFATFSVTSHGLVTGQTYYLDFTSGTGPDGSYVITNTGTNSFTANLVTTPGANGNVTIGGSSQLTNGDYVVNVTTTNQFEITTVQTTGVAGATATSVLVNSAVVGGAGGAGTMYPSYTYRSLNNVISAGTIGLGGAGGGGGGAELTSGSTPNYGKGGVGGDGSIGAGGGGGGSFGTGNPSSDAGDGGAGGGGLVLITYIRPRAISETSFIV